VPITGSCRRCRRRVFPHCRGGKHHLAKSRRERREPGFAGGQLIGPLKTDSARWNNTVNRSSGFAGQRHAGRPSRRQRRRHGAGRCVELQQHLVPTATARGTTSTSWRSAYLDDWGSGVTVTFTNVPYARYRVYGLAATDQNGSGLFACGTGRSTAPGRSAATATPRPTRTAGSRRTTPTTARNWTKLVPGAVTATTGRSSPRAPLHGPRPDQRRRRRGCLTAAILESFPLDWGAPAAPRTYADGADVTCPLLYAAATTTVVWAKSDRGAGSTNDWRPRPAAAPPARACSTPTTR